MRTTTPINTRKSAAVRDNAVTARAVSRKATVDNSADLAVNATRSIQAQALVDPFTSYYLASTATYAVMAPEWNPYQLLRMPNECSILRQCIDAMVTNICSFGYRLEYIGPPDQDKSPAAMAERNRIEGLLEQPNGEYSFTELRSRIRRDLETFGYTFIEVGRDKQSGDITLLNHVPSQTMRQTAKETKKIEVEQIIYRNGLPTKIKVLRRFRRYVQQVGSNMVYFKEFGDPRLIDPNTGAEPDAQAKPIDFNNSANEIYHVQLYTPGSAYGIPRWVSQLPSVMGLRESELTNLQFFKDNAIPAMAVLVSGGAVSNSSVSNIENHFTAGRGRESHNRVLVIEATADDEAARVDSTIPTPKLDLKPLVSERQTDGHFLEYEKSCVEKVRSSFRIAPILCGVSQDYNRATSESAIVVCDAQVFGPERNREDEMYNSHFLISQNRPLQYWNLRTNPPRLVSPDQVLDAIELLDSVGALTPNIAIGIANELFDLHLVPIEQAWGDYPFAIVKGLAQAGNLQGIEDIMIGELNDDSTNTEKNGADGTPSNKPEPKSKDKVKQDQVTDDPDKAKKQIRTILVKKFSDIDVMSRRRPIPRFRERRRLGAASAPGDTKVAVRG